MVSCDFCNLAASGSDLRRAPFGHGWDDGLVCRRCYEGSSVAGEPAFEALDAPGPAAESGKPTCATCAAIADVLRANGWTVVPPDE